MDTMSLFSKRAQLSPCLEKVRKIFGADYIIDIDKNANKCFLIAWILLNSFEEQEYWILARHFLEKAEKLGDYKASFNLGLLIAEGVLREENLDRGLEYIKASAERGFGKAYGTLGLHFLRRVLALQKIVKWLKNIIIKRLHMIIP